MNTDKIATYLGFALRAGKVTLGINAAQTLKKGVSLLLLDKSTAENSKKEARKLRAKFSCPLIELEEPGALLKRQGVKLIAVKDASLAGAIISEARAQGISVEGAIG